MMLTRLKQAASGMLTSRPVYRALPRGALRTYAALKYHGENSTPEETARFVQSLTGVPTRPFSVAMVAAKAVFRAGHDDLLEQTLAALEQRYPGAAAVELLRCDVHAFHGRYPEALDGATRARDRHPSSTAATARLVRLAYLTRDRGEADELAVHALRRFPRSAEVLWAVARPCTSPEQYGRLQAAWDETLPEPIHLPRGIRQLSTAAARAGRIDAAQRLYRRAITLLADGTVRGRLAGDPRLSGRSAWTAVEDLQQALDESGVPFFFAAGTALGLVREGGPLAADSDIDIGIFEADWNRDALIEAFRHHPKFDLNLHPQTGKVALRHRGGSPVDVFRFYQEGNKLWHDGVFVRWFNTPFEIDRIELRGVKRPIPSDADRYLTENYGAWRTPNASFDAFTEDAPNLEVTWPAYHRLHRLRRAYQCLVRGDRARALVELEHAGEPELHTKVDSAG